MTDLLSPASEVRRNLRDFRRRLRLHPVLRAWRWWSHSVVDFLPSLWRLATHQGRQLPSAVIIGAQKAGTTQLFAHLTRHPRLLSGCAKEVDYFSKHFHRSLRWYRSQFPLQQKVAAVGGYTLEASPSYMCTPAALHRMREVLPEAKIIALLRDPVARAFSAYHHAKTRHRERRSFGEAVETQLRENVVPARLGAAIGPNAPQMGRYVARGYYALQLDLLFRLYPPEQTLILDSADLFRDTNAACQAVFEFLGVEPCDVPAEKVYNRGCYDEKIDPLVAARLREHYRPYDELLVELLGREFSWMQRATTAAARKSSDFRAGNWPTAPNGAMCALR